MSSSVFGAGTGNILVSNEMDNTVTFIDGETFEIIKIIPTGERPRDMRWHKENTQLLIAASGSDRIEVLDVASLEIVGFLEAGEDPEIFNIDPSGTPARVSFMERVHWLFVAALWHS